MLGEPLELWVRAGAGKDPGIAFGESTPALALERTGDDYRPATSTTGIDDLVNEVNKLVWKPNRDLLAHPKMVSKWEQSWFRAGGFSSQISQFAGSSQI
jgi:hypothetical protein